MRIIVIGASGFIGTYLIQELISCGNKVIATGRNPVIMGHMQRMGVECYSLDITNKDTFKKLPTENIDGVVLLAALLPANVNNNNPYDYIDINIKGTLNVLEFCRKNNITKIISTTSYADVYNHWQKDIPISADIFRDYKLEGDHAEYIISKNAATDLILYYNKQYNLQGSIFRLPPVYGYGPHSEIYVDGKYYKSGFQIFLDNAQAGKSIEIYGNKDLSRDVVYVKDVAKAFISALNSSKSKGVYNISSGIATTLENQVKDIINVFCDKKKDISKIIYSPEKPNSGKSYVLDISKASKDFGYKPEYVPFKKLLQDYKDEMTNKRFEYLVKARKISK